MIESFIDRRLLLYECEPLRRDLLKLRAEEKSYGIRLTSPRDKTGHGDLFSAFSVALLVAHEIAGDAPVVAGCDLFGDSGTPFEQAIRAFERRAMEYQDDIDAGDETSEAWYRLMQLVGRRC